MQVDLRSELRMGLAPSSSRVSKKRKGERREMECSRAVLRRGPG